MMWGPALNEPTTRSVPRVVPKEKAAPMWEHWNRPLSQKCQPRLVPTPRKGQTLPDISGSQKPGAQVNFGTLRHNSFLRTSEKTRSKQIIIRERSRFTSASLRCDSFPPKQRKPPIQGEMLFTSASLRFLSDLTVIVSSSRCPHTHTHTHVTVTVCDNSSTRALTGRSIHKARVWRPQSEVTLR